MATDNSPPKIRVILTIAFSSVVILGALNFVFRSYFQMMTDEANHSHLRPPAELLKLREGEQKNLASGALPIDKAIAELAAQGREGDALKDIAPQASNDMGPMVGWIRAPNQAIVDRLTAEANAAADAGATPETTGDGGVTASADGGVALATDGGGGATTTHADAGATHTAVTPVTPATPDAGATPHNPVAPVAPAPKPSPDHGDAPKPGH